MLRRLAEGLHHHRIGAVSILRGVEPYELSEVLQALSTEPDRAGPLGLRTELLATWTHVKVHPLTFDGLALVGEGSAAGEGETAQNADLWIGLARAALSSDNAKEPSDGSAEPTAVAKAINENPGAEAYDQVIVGHLLQIARELNTATGQKADELRRRTSRLIGSLKPATLRRLVEMGGNPIQRGQFVRDAANGMAVEAVVEIVRAAGEASGQTISHGLVRMLSKLAMHAEQGSDTARPLASVELREQVSSLLHDWQLEDPNPEAYGKVLQHLATSSQGDASPMSREVSQRPDPLRILQMGLESGASGPLADRAMDELVQTGRVGEALELLASRPHASCEAADGFLSRLTSPEAIRSVLAREPLDVAGLDAMLPRLSPDGYKQLLDALASSENRTTRRRLLDRLASTTVDIGALVLAHLDDERWFVQRNMLLLLERLGHVPEGFSPAHWTTHPDARVRCEAFRIQLTIPDERGFAVAAALHDVDTRVIHLGLTAVQQECPADVVGRVLELTRTPDYDDSIRLLALGALSRVRQPSVLLALLKLADGGRTLRGRWRLPPKTPVLVLVIRTLSRGWAHDPRAGVVLTAAAESSDAELRAAAGATNV